MFKDNDVDNEDDGDDKEEDDNKVLYQIVQRTV